jgi:hypothetical protein
VVIVAVVLLWRVARRAWTGAEFTDPTLAGAAIGLVLGHIVGRFWTDWGMVAAAAFVAREFDSALAGEPRGSRGGDVARCAAVCIAFAVVLSADVGGRWSSSQQRPGLHAEDLAPEDRTWFPDSGGIVYNIDMVPFYEMFFQNPTAPWRYLLGFEPTLMRPEDLEVFRALVAKGYAPSACQPWVGRMKPADRFLLTSPPVAVAPFTDLEWRKVRGAGYWLGRVRAPHVTPPGQLSADRTPQGIDPGVPCGPR